MAQNVVKALRKTVAAEAIHGDKSQNARQRVLEAFKNKEVGVLVATDIAARGIDIDQLPLLSTLIYQIFPKHTFIE
jgi:ATP-dependent RNA helicase RhlE